MSDSDVRAVSAKSRAAESRLVMRVAQMIKLLNVYLNHFPRHERYALANRIRNTAIDIYDLVIEAQKRYHKKTSLTSLDIAHERLRMQLWLANELGYFEYKDGRDRSGGDVAVQRYLSINRLVDEVGRMIGGWISAVRERS